MPPTTSNPLEWALYYLALGLCVIPLHGITPDGKCTCGKSDCPNPGKHPRILWKEFMERLPTTEEVRGWWGQWPNSNIGILTGKISDWILVDVDGEKGIFTLREKKFALSPEIPHAQTGGGGYHWLYGYPGFPCRNFAGKIGHTILPKVDFRGDGGLFVAPPSMHASGQKYQWIVGIEEGKKLPPPEWLADLIKGQDGEKKEKPQRKPQRSAQEDSAWVTELLLGVDEGGRNVACTRLAGYYLRKLRGDKAIVLTILDAWDLRNKPPMGAEAVEKIVGSISGRQGKDELGEVLLITIIKVIFLKSLDGQGMYIFYFDVNGVEENCRLSGDDIISQTRFRRRIVSLTNLLLPPVEKKQYFDLMSKVIKEAEKSEMPLDITLPGILLEIIQKGFQKPSENVDDIDRRIVVAEDHIYLKIKPLRYHLDNTEKLSRQQIGEALFILGFRDTYRIYDSKKTKHRVWGIAKKEFDIRHSEQL